MTAASVAAISEASARRLSQRLGSTAGHNQLDRGRGRHDVFALMDVPEELRLAVRDDLVE